MKQITDLSIVQLKQITDLSIVQLKYLVDIYTMLSPENLNCDSECSAAEAGIKYSNLQKKLNDFIIRINIDRICAKDELIVYREWVKKNAL